MVKTEELKRMLHLLQGTSLLSARAKSLKVEDHNKTNSPMEKIKENMCFEIMLFLHLTLNVHEKSGKEVFALILLVA